ncbi:MAG: ATP-binding cassette domain-containing protein [Deltaproteobacteria bacterium]|jgi:putative ABC transport system ATP-binding protein|nr:ATP-binding cassette domain-containing protein [Deltaproteobacteria bacterium]
MLKLSGLYKTFGQGGPNEIVALRGLDLLVKKGELVTIIGSNGSGKSTLMGCVAGSLAVDAGTIVLGSANVTAWPERRRASLISRVFQDPLSGTCASMTVEENLALAHRRGRPRGLRRGILKGEREFFRAALAPIGLGLESRLTDQVGLLSGGQRQALTLVMATMVRPALLLLDEHTAAQDPKTAALTMRLTMELVERDKLTTLMITHNLNQALEYGQRLVMLNQGRVVLDFAAEAKATLTVKSLLDHFLASAERGDSFSDSQLFN